VASHKKLTFPKIKALQILENMCYYSCDNDSFHKNNAFHVFLQPVEETKEKTTRMMPIELKAETCFKMVTAKTLKLLGLLLAFQHIQGLQQTNRKYIISTMRQTSTSLARMSASINFKLAVSKWPS